MFSYRHAFHAGNHADVLKHLTLIAAIEHLMHKEPGIQFVDTHAGAGLYRLDGDYAAKSGEAAEGYLKMRELALDKPLPALQNYLDMVASFNAKGSHKIYPGSPFIIHKLLRHEARDRLKLFELHPTDHKSLSGNIEQLAAGRTVSVARADGFESLKALLPPPASSSGSRRTCVLIDPSYEMKNDYFRVLDCIQDSLKRFATGTYIVWYPIVPRPEAHDLPRKLKILSGQVKKPWLHATLAIGRATGGADTGLSASGMFLINPPFSLKPLLNEALPVIEKALGRGPGQGWTVESGG
jgi:23S rRNA (adenine2030-N6)-methyltransferase